VASQAPKLLLPTKSRLRAHAHSRATILSEHHAPNRCSPCVYSWFNHELDSLTCRLLAGDREPHDADRLLQSIRFWNTPTHPPNPTAEEQAFQHWVTASLARYHQPSLCSPGIARYRTSRQLSWRPLAPIAFTPTCSCPDTSCRKAMHERNGNDSFERPCGYWPLSPCHAHLAQAPDEF
jgi:hypothetical protein